MVSSNKPGGATPLGRIVSAALITGAIIGAAYWFLTRPKAEVLPVATPSISEVLVPAQKGVEPARVDIQQAASAAPAAKQQQTSGSDDPWSNLNTKGVKQ